MSTIEFVGMLVAGITALGGMFGIIYKPLNENTKAMTTLTVHVEELTKKMEEHDEELKEYKAHVSEGQQKQWDSINRHTEEINLLKIKMEGKEHEI